MAKRFSEQGFIDVNKKRLSITSTPNRPHDFDVTHDVNITTVEVSKPPYVNVTDDIKIYITTVEVSRIPVATSEEYLRMYFESERRSGGGELVHLQYFQAEGTAIITFKDHTGTRKVLIWKRGFFWL